MNIIELAEIIGILSFSLSGFLIAIESKLDLLGIFIASFLTALGGGVIRDVIVSKELYAFENNFASILVIFVVFIGILLKIKNCSCVEKHPLFVIADTLGLVSFAISGALIATEAGFNFFGVLLLSLITAVGGGVLRDILINKIPTILVSEFYGTVALVVGLLIYLLNLIDGVNFWTISTVFVLGVILRLIAFYKSWHLPKIL
jgi:uncharacterized membrane protein YeiH